MKRLSSPLLLILLLSGCGFHLRGSQMPEDLPDIHAQLICPVNAAPDLCTVLSRRLQSTGLQTGMAPARFTITISEPAEALRAVSISQSADAAENEISRTVSWTVTDTSDGKLIEGRQTRRQSYRYDKTSGLGNDAEQARIRHDLDMQLAESLAGRISAALRTLVTAAHAD